MAPIIAALPLALSSRSPVHAVVMGIHGPANADPVGLLVSAIPELAVDGHGPARTAGLDPAQKKRAKYWY